MTPEIIEIDPELIIGYFAEGKRSYSDPEFLKKAVDGTTFNDLLWDAVRDLPMEQRVLSLIAAVPMCSRDITHIVVQDPELSGGSLEGWKILKGLKERGIVETHSDREPHVGAGFNVVVGRQPNWDAGYRLMAERRAHYEEQRIQLKASQAARAVPPPVGGEA